MITGATGIPLAVILTGANRNDVTQLRSLLDAIPKVRGKRGRPRQRPDVVLADRGYDHDKYRALVCELQVCPPIARRGTEHGSSLGKSDGSSSRPSPCRTVSADCTSAGKSGPTSRRPSSSWPAPSSAGGASLHYVRRSKSAQILAMRCDDHDGLHGGR
ncbi:transposase [Nonomuraea sp. NPDC048826]|uniref:transposase n=1 Tax=Nonomuraea sp. NPDC048826 TaxID=3364347 RepID=UPI00371A2017